MKRLDLRSVVVVILAAAAGCKGDPTADLRTGVNSLALNPDLMYIDQGTTKGFEVVARDQQLNPVAASVTVTSADQAVVTVAPDNSVPSADGAHFDFVVTAVGAGQTKLVASASGVSDTATVTVLPATLAITGSSTTPAVGQSFSLYANALFGFDPDSGDIDFGAGVTGTIIRRVGDTLTVRVPQPERTQPAPLTVVNAAVKYVPGMLVTLPTAATFDVTNPFGNNSSPNPAATVTLPAQGDSTIVWDGFKLSEADNYYSVTLAQPDTLTFTLSWDGNADLDMYVCNAPCAATADFLGGVNRFDAATSANPETMQLALPAGTFNLYVNQFDTGDNGAHLYKIRISNP